MLNIPANQQLIPASRFKKVRPCFCAPLVILLLSSAFSPLSCWAQLFGHTTPTFEIPFAYENGFMVVDVTLNDLLPLKFIFDTGAEHTILTKKEIAKFLGLTYERRFNIIGSDMNQELYAYLARHVQIQFGNLRVPNQSILVLDNDYLNFEEFTGMRIHGILGADLFRSFVVSINYVQRKIKFTSTKNFKKPPRSYEEIPLEIFRKKLYVSAWVNIQGERHEARLLLDTGAALPLLLHNNSAPAFSMPANVLPGNVGAGLGGDLNGYLGKAISFSFAGSSKEVRHILVNYQEITPQMDTFHLHGRHGLVGNKILYRYHFIINYPQEKLYITPNRYFNHKYKFDKSGISVIAGGHHLNQFFVHSVIPNSPADRAGVKKGDRILSLNGMSAQLLSLDLVTNKLKRRTGKKIKLLLKRDDTRFKTVFRLQDLF